MPTVRDPDGVALSSRNRYLSPQERTVAVEFARRLQQAARREKDGDAWLRGALKSMPGLRLDYVEISGGRLHAAIWIGTTRLIDNERLH